MQVSVPIADSSFRAGTVTEWHVKEGDTISFGDDLCSIAIDQFMALRRTKRAVLLGSTTRRRKRRVSDGYSFRDGRGETHMTLKSAETNVTVGRILVDVGDRAAVGEPLAVLVVGEVPATLELSDETGDLVEARVSVDLAEPGGTDQAHPD